VPAGSFAQLMRPMLPVAGPLPAGGGWAFEFSWDGLRCLASAAPERASLFSASHRSISAAYPELTALAGRHRVLLDGKIVALDSCGRPSLARLARRMNLQRPTSVVLRRVPVSYYVFDLLSLDGACTAELPYQRRRELLAELEFTGGPIVAPPCFLNTPGEVVLETAAAHGLPGVIAKRLDSTYQPGRSRSWVQTTLRQTQEVIIGGWVPERRRAAAVGALLVGVPTTAGLRYVGQVGTGFTEASRQELYGRLTKLAAPASPFADEVAPESGRLESGRVVHWVAPALLGEVSYRQWTARGLLAHPTWRGLRPAKHVAAVKAPVVVCAREGGEQDADQALVAELEGAVAQVRTELRRLRDQVSPHFVHNMISTIVALISTDPSRARDLLIVFAEFARYMLRSATQTTLDAELENIERYLTLQQARFGARLQVQLQVVPGALPVVLPFLALQQLVDNAVRNGIERMQLGGTLTLSARLEGPDCLITVQDDGPGEADADLPATLRTIDSQLQDRFGERYGLVADFIPGTGTTISIRVPAASGERR
jgi:DNA ligase D-like protein (predicted ligase)